MADINAPLKQAINGPGPQHKVEGKQEFEFTEGSEGKLHTKDIDVLTELKAIKEQGFKEYRILSSDPMPEAKADEKGASLLIMDTGEVYFNHGGTWGVF